MHAGENDAALLRELNRNLSSTLDCADIQEQDVAETGDADSGIRRGCKQRVATVHQKRQQLILEYRLRCKMGIVVALRRLEAIDMAEEL